MPGMMDTILNLGLNDEAVEGLARATGNDRFAWDAYRRLVQMYGNVVDGVDAHAFEHALAALKEDRRARDDVDLAAATSASSSSASRRSTATAAARTSRRIRACQLERAVRAVFDSWDTPRAQVYRRANGIPDDLGTAVNVVQMVFGNKGEDSGTGVAFTREPFDGRAGGLGGVPDERAGGGRRRRDPHAAADRAG